MGTQNVLEGKVSLKKCVKCLLPETYETIEFDEEGVCNICRSVEYKQRNVDWVERKQQLSQLIEKYRGKNDYDCIIPFSGGKDSTFALYYIVKNLKFKIKIFENLLDGSEHFALIKGNIKKGITPRLRVISSNVVQNYLINQKLPNSFINTLNYFKKYNNCVLVFIRDINLKSVSQTLRDYKSKEFYRKGKDKLIKNYGIGAQIIKSLNIKNMILVTRSKKKVVGLEGYGIKITKQEIIK